MPRPATHVRFSTARKPDRSMSLAMQHPNCDRKSGVGNTFLAGNCASRTRPEYGPKRSAAPQIEVATGSFRLPGQKRLSGRAEREWQARPGGFGNAARPCPQAGGVGIARRVGSGGTASRCHARYGGKRRSTMGVKTRPPPSARSRRPRAARPGRRPSRGGPRFGDVARSIPPRAGL